jgi:hypothetical protein
MLLHPYTESLKINIKWFIKRTLTKSNPVDKSIQTYLKKVISDGVIYNRGLNIGAGYYTPNDKWMEKITPKITHLDSTRLVKVFRPFTGKRVILNDDNYKNEIKKFSPETIYCFHTFSFIQIDWVDFIDFCSDYGIKLIFDWSIRPSNEINDGVNRFCLEPDAQKFFSKLLESGYKVMNLENHEQISDIKFIQVDGRFLVSNFN